jgi:hypothetical protein
MCYKVLIAYINLLHSVVKWIGPNITEKLIQKTDKNILEHRFDSARIYNKLAKRSNNLARAILNHSTRMILNFKKENNLL